MIDHRCCSYNYLGEHNVYNTGSFATKKYSQFIIIKYYVIIKFENLKIMWKTLYLY